MGKIIFLAGPVQQGPAVIDSSKWTVLSIACSDVPASFAPLFRLNTYPYIHEEEAYVYYD